MLLAGIRREFQLAKQRGAELVNPLLFYVLIVALFPLALEPDAELLKAIAPGIVWIAALLSCVSGLDSLFRADYEDGSVAQWFLQPAGAWHMVIAKLLSHWLLSALPIILLSPVVGYALGLKGWPLTVLCLGLILGTPVLSCVGAIAAALTVSVKRGGALLSLILLPLFVPVLIFGAQAARIAQDQLSVSGQFYLLAALSVLSITLGVGGVYAALKISIEN